MRIRCSIAVPVHAGTHAGRGFPAECECALALAIQCVYNALHENAARETIVNTMLSVICKNLLLSLPLLRCAVRGRWLVVVAFTSAACTSAMPIQKEYVEARDNCQEIAELKFETFHGQKAEYMSQNARNQFLVNAFNQCMSLRNWQLSHSGAKPVDAPKAKSSSHGGKTVTLPGEVPRQEEGVLTPEAFATAVPDTSAPLVAPSGVGALRSVPSAAGVAVPAPGAAPAPGVSVSPAVPPAVPSAYGQGYRLPPATAYGAPAPARSSTPPVGYTTPRYRTVPAASPEMRPSPAVAPSRYAPAPHGGGGASSSEPARGTAYPNSNAAYPSTAEERIRSVLSE